MDTVQLLNALTILGFIYLASVAKTPLIAFAITGVWVSSFLYHALASAHKHTMSNWFMVPDCAFQIFTFIAVLLASSCFKEYKHMLISINIVLISTIIILALTDMTRYKTHIVAITAFAHLMHGVAGLFTRCSQHPYYFVAMAFLALIGLVYIACEHSERLRCMWPVAHMLMVPYIYFYLESSANYGH